MLDGKIHVAIIDDGIQSEYTGVSLFHDLEIFDDLSIGFKNKGELKDISHGTKCFAIIKKYVKVSVEYSSIKILNERRRSNVSKLYKALEWCTENFVDIANVSLGSISQFDYEEIQKNINQSYRKGLIVVCAAHNFDFETYPASLSNVIGVKCDKENRLKEGEWELNSYREDGIEFTAYSNHEVIWENGETEKLGIFNSYAAPLITAETIPFLIKYIHKRYSVDKIEYLKNELSLHGKQESKFSGGYYRADWIEKCEVVFIRYEDRYLERYSNLCVIKLKSKEELYQYFINCDKDIDTIFLYFNERIELDVVQKLLKLSDNTKKNIIFVDSYNYLYNKYLCYQGKKCWIPNEVHSEDSNIVKEDSEEIPIISIESKAVLDNNLYNVSSEMSTTDNISEETCTTNYQTMPKEKWVTLYLAKSLQQNFIKDGYSACILSDFLDSALINEECLINSEHIHSKMLKRKNSDLCICCFDNKSTELKLMEDIGIIIEIENDNYKCELRTENNRIDCIYEDTLQKLSNILYDKVLNLLI